MSDEKLDEKPEEESNDSFDEQLDELGTFAVDTWNVLLESTHFNELFALQAAGVIKLETVLETDREEYYKDNPVSESESDDHLGLKDWALKKANVVPFSYLQVPDHFVCEFDRIIYVFKVVRSKRHEGLIDAYNDKNEPTKCVIPAMHDPDDLPDEISELEAEYYEAAVNWGGWMIITPGRREKFYETILEKVFVFDTEHHEWSECDD